MLADLVDVEVFAVLLWVDVTRCVDYLEPFAISVVRYYAPTKAIPFSFHLECAAYRFANKAGW